MAPVTSLFERQQTNAIKASNRSCIAGTQHERVRWKNACCEWDMVMVRFSEPRPVVIDTDPGVDDALALMLALRSPELRVELITTVAGNVPVQTATANARRLLALLNASPCPTLAQGASRPLYRPLHTSTTAHGPDGLGGLTRLRHADGRLRYPLPNDPPVRQRAVQRLLRLAHLYGPALTIIALGPLTNLARAIQRDPETMQRVGRLLIMGGAIRVPGNVSPTAEFNIFVDPHAAAIVFNAGLPIVLIPLDVTRQVRLTHRFLQETTRGRASALAQATRQMTRSLLVGAWKTRGMPMHDPLAVAVAVDASLVHLTTLPVGVETRGQQTLGMTVADQRATARQASSFAPVQVALEVDAPRVLALFAERVLARPKPPARQHRSRAGVLVVGSANTDLSVRVPHLPGAGETVLGSTFFTAFGGKGANQALASQRAGARVAFLTKLGQDRYGQDYVRYLQQEGLDMTDVQWDSGLPSGIALITVDRHGQNQIAVAAGANAALHPAHLQGLERHLGSSRVLLTQLEIPLVTVEAALRQAKAAGMTTLLNPAPAQPLPARLSHLVDILVPNEQEAALLCGKPVRTLRQAQRAASDLHQRGYDTVIITLGARGLVYTNAQASSHLPAHIVQVRDTTAAGDTFVGYLACALAEGRLLADALQVANAAAALTVTREGAQPSIPHRSDVQQFLSRVDRSVAPTAPRN